MLNRLTLRGHFTDAALGPLQKPPALGRLDFSGPGAVFGSVAANNFKRNMPRPAIFRGFETDCVPCPAQTP